MQYSYSGKRVIRGSQVVQEILDGHQKAQAADWCLIDIFAPFRAEYECGLEFGSLWQEWVRDMAAATRRLAKKPRRHHEENEEDIVKIFESPKAGLA